MTVAACIRGGEPAPAPPVSVMTEQEYATYLNGLLSEDGPPPSPNHYENALVLLRLATPGALSQGNVVSDQAKGVGAIYRDDTKDIVIIEHAEKLDVVGNSVLLVHELIHALEDRDIDLAAFREEHATSLDSFLAVRALIEGEARLHEDRYASAVLGLDPATLDWRKRFDGAIDARAADLATEASIYGPGYQLFPYAWGARYAYVAFESGGLEGVLARYASPSLTSRAIMASSDAPVPDEPAPPAIATPALPEEWSLFTEATLGAFGVYLLTEKVTVSATRPESTALAWRNDRLFVFESLTGGTAAIWHIDFATEADAVTFAQTLNAAALTTRQSGTGVAINVSNVALTFP